MQFGIFERVVQASARWFAAANETSDASSPRKAETDEEVADEVAAHDPRRPPQEIDTAPFCLPPFPPC
ncbi:hypothetical protein CJ010_22155 [Azoarcus sp. DD4]|uniref:hypothetical protein n=1 Tax=Azoarcus sp. DD4 TaxID=2027405 RepID=UPI001128F194|nr:hypothetical protein [Azoarcus sp. DD4]QDF99048.1 hypothetical protein CJ010_22155 [Azoarcus sp. DD4]